MDICVGDLHESYRMPAVGATASATTSNAIPDIVASTASAAFSMTWGTTKDIRLKITFLLTLASLIGGFISLVISATLIHRFGVPLDRWFPESSLLFLPAYVLSAGLIALTLFKHRGRVPIK